ncbi:MAG: RelA/SpoT family protein, partial [Patescibacteria group bacterium]
MLSEQELRSSLKTTARTYLSDDEWLIVERAIEVASRHHAGMTRVSGEPYLTHPLSVALFLANLQLDAHTLAAGVLHDALEDTDLTAKDLEAQFGKDVATLVVGVTKLQKVQIHESTSFVSRILERRNEKRLAFERQVESLRKMLIAMAKDIRVVLIKLADRLHNMQTLDSFRPEKQTRIAEETLEIYAPIAYRLGMGQIKGDLEDLAFPYVYPKEYASIQSVLEEKIEQRERYIRRFARILQTYLEAEGLKGANIHGRVKHTYSLWRKLQRYDGDMGKIYDLIAIRIIVPSASDCYKTLGLIHSRWNPLIGRIKDYIATPKPNGYRSLHTTVFGLDGEIIEIQIRTPEMHEQAEQGVAAHWSYNESKHLTQHATTPLQAETKLEWLNELRTWQDSLKNPLELREALLLEFFTDQIFVFTPTGEVITL